MVQHKIYHDNFDYKNAFKFLKEANNLKKHRLGYNIERDRSLFELINNNFSYSYSPPIVTKKSLPSNEVNPIFIVGLPRSGTSL